MKLRMHENSLFAILLRSPWWISFAIAALVVAAARLLVPIGYAIAVAAPFFGLGCVAAWKQLRAPSARKVEETLEAARGMSWADFSARLEKALERDGYVVKRLDEARADFEVRKDGRRALVCGRRWKAARAGIEPLRDLDAARRGRDVHVHEAIYVAAGEISDNARTFAAEKNIRLLHGAELVQLLRKA
jgi:restriction system protein